MWLFIIYFSFCDIVIPSSLGTEFLVLAPELHAFSAACATSFFQRTVQFANCVRKNCIDFVYENTEALVQGNREDGLEVNTEKIKGCVVISRHENAEQFHNVLWKCDIVQVFENNSNKSELHSRRN